MRLICPNCSTQYEVDDSAVPASGREVQCGSCSSTWFQAPARSNVPQGAEKGDLPKWVEDIVEDDAAEEARELPGQAPRISSEPNEEIVSEPELEVIIDSGDLETGAVQSDTPVKSERSVEAPVEAPDRAKAEAADIAPADAPDTEAPDAKTPVDAPVEEQDSAKAAATAKAIAQSVAAAAIAAKLTGSDKKPEVAAPSQEPTPAPQSPEIAEASAAPVPAVDLPDVEVAASGDLEIPEPEANVLPESVQALADDTKEMAEAKIDFETIADAEEITKIAPSIVDQALEPAVETVPDSPIEALNETVADAVEDVSTEIEENIEVATETVDESSPFETTSAAMETPLEFASDADVASPADVTLPADGTSPADVDDVSTQLETAIKENTSATKEDFPAIAAAELEASKAAEVARSDVASATDEAVKAAERAAALDMAEKAAARDLVESSGADDIAQDVAAATSEQSSETDDIEAQIKGALEELDAGKNLPDDPNEERLSDYDFTDGDAADVGDLVPDEFAVDLPSGENNPRQGITDAYDPSDISVEAPEQDVAQMVTSPSAVDPMVEAIERDAAEDQTESLAAKLKARVAEAAKAQESSTIGTAGVVLGASAAGIAATSARRSTDFPKRDTQELASSLRPKPVDGNSLKPRLRPAATPEPTKSRFGQGFIMAIALFAVAFLIYMFRDQLATALPVLEPALTSYAGVIDNVRIIFQDAIGKLTGSATT